MPKELSKEVENIFKKNYDENGSTTIVKKKMGKIKWKKFLIVSPHSDDALFCCSHTLFLPEYEVQVLTVENDPKRIAEG